jgi:cobalt-zinc-cadmium efflux system outer membrane protein
MRTKDFILGIALLAGCGAPEPVSLEELHGRDLRFTPVSRSKEAAREILRKDELTLEDALAVADALNPRIAAEAGNVDLAVAESWEAQLYPNPSALLKIEDYRPRDGATAGKSERKAGAVIPLVLSGRLGKAADLAEAEREAAALQYLWRRREILAETKGAFISHLAALRSAELARETRDLARSVLEVSEERYKAQAVPEMEVLKASVALARAEIDLRDAAKGVEVARGALASLMGDAAAVRERFSGGLAGGFADPGLGALRERLLGGHPLLESANRALEAAGMDLALARAERLPDPQLEVLAGKDAEDEAILEGGLLVPLPLFNRNQGRIAAARARIRRAERQAEAARNDLLQKLGESYSAFSAAQDRAKAFREGILPQAEKALAQTSEGYRLGKFTVLDLLDAQRTLAESKAASVSALRDLNLAAAELEKLTGTRLEPIR